MSDMMNIMHQINQEMREHGRAARWQERSKQNEALLAEALKIKQQAELAIVGANAAGAMVNEAADANTEDDVSTFRQIVQQAEQVVRILERDRQILEKKIL